MRHTDLLARVVDNLPELLAALIGLVGALFAARLAVRSEERTALRQQQAERYVRLLLNVKAVNAHFDGLLAALSSGQDPTGDTEAIAQLMETVADETLELSLFVSEQVNVIVRAFLALWLATLRQFDGEGGMPPEGGPVPATPMPPVAEGPSQQDKTAQESSETAQESSEVGKGEEGADDQIPYPVYPEESRELIAAGRDHLLLAFSTMQEALQRALRLDLGADRLRWWGRRRVKRSMLEWEKFTTEFAVNGEEPAG